MLLNSDIIMCAAQPEHGELRRFIAEQAPAVSAVSMVEVLGYPRLSARERQRFEEFFAAATILPLSTAVLEQAVKLRQQKELALGDALIAATALVYYQKLVTRNAADFEGIVGLELFNPFDKTTTLAVDPGKPPPNTQ